MNHFPQSWGTPRDEIYGPYDRSSLPSSGSKQYTLNPLVTGTSVVSIKFKDGVVIAADNLASYGSLARFRDVQRLRKLNNRTVLGFGGDMSDMQYINRLMAQLAVESNYSDYPPDNEDDEAPGLDARSLFTWVSRIMYSRRTRFDPLWNHILVAGLDAEETPFLASVDLLGTTFSSPCIATGFGAHLAVPILRRLVPDEAAASKLEAADAIRAIKQCMQVLFYRDARSLDRYSISVIRKGKGAEILTDQTMEAQSWSFAESVKGYGSQVV